MRRVIISLVAIIAMAVVFNACRKDSPVKGERVVKSNPEFTDCNE